MQRAGLCPISTRASRCDLRCPKTLQCPRCAWKTSEIMSYMKHVREHYAKTACEMNEEEAAALVEARTHIDLDVDNDDAMVGRECLRAGGGHAPTHDGRLWSIEAQGSAKHISGTPLVGSRPCRGRRIAAEHGETVPFHGPSGETAHSCSGAVAGSSKREPLGGGTPQGGGSGLVIV